MIPTRHYIRKALVSLLAVLPMLVLTACQDDPAAPQTETVSVDSTGSTGAGDSHVLTEPQAARHQDVIAPQETTPETLPPADSPRQSGTAVNPQFTVGQNQYIFDISNHSREELMALLKRADEISTVSDPAASNLDIALILHSEDIGWFSKQHYQDNKELVDLAARLDALKVIDLKVCEKAIQHYGYTDSDIPDFIDRVPYAPDEMQRLEGAGYFRL